MFNYEKAMEVRTFLITNKGYQKWGSEKLALKLDCSVEEVVYAKTSIKGTNKIVFNSGLSIIGNAEFDKIVDDFIDNKNESKITEFDSYLTSQGLTQEDVKSVKFCQTYSLVLY